MRTISKSDIERSVELLNNLTDNKRKFGIEYSYGGCRLTSNNGSVNISERGTKRETYTFIRAYIDGVATGYEHAKSLVGSCVERRQKSLTEVYISAGVGHSHIPGWTTTGTAYICNSTDSDSRGSYAEFTDGKCSLSDVGVSVSWIKTHMLPEERQPVSV